MASVCISFHIAQSIWRTLTSHSIGKDRSSLMLDIFFFSAAGKDRFLILKWLRCRVFQLTTISGRNEAFCLFLRIRCTPSTRVCRPLATVAARCPLTCANGQTSLQKVTLAIHLLGETIITNASRVKTSCSISCESLYRCQYLFSWGQIPAV